MKCPDCIRWKVALFFFAVKILDLKLIPCLSNTGDDDEESSKKKSKKQKDLAYLDEKFAIDYSRGEV